MSMKRQLLTRTAPEIVYTNRWRKSVNIQTQPAGALAFFFYQYIPSKGKGSDELLNGFDALASSLFRVQWRTHCAPFTTCCFGLFFHRFTERQHLLNSSFSQSVIRVLSNRHSIQWIASAFHKNLYKKNLLLSQDFIRFEKTLTHISSNRIRPPHSIKRAARFYIAGPLVVLFAWWSIKRKEIGKFAE